MFEGIKKALLRRRHSPEYAEHRLRVERTVARMPGELATKAWRDWLWKLPPQAWLEAVDLRVLKPSDPEEEIRGITRRSRALAGNFDATAEIAAIREEARRKDREIAERRREFVQKWGEPPI